MALLTPPAQSLPGSVLPITTSTPTSSPASTPSPYLFFLPLPTLTTCGEYTIIWEASGDITNLAITITDHTLNSPLSPIDNSTFSEVIATGLNPTSNVFFWNPIAVPDGTYVLVGTVNGLASPSYSSQFAVTNGSDISCLSGTSSIPASSSSPTLASSSSSSSSSNSHLAGAIAGGVIGGLALIAILIALFLFCRAYRSARRSRRNPAGHGTMRSWKGLSSAAARDSTFPGGLPAYRVNKSYRGRGETESTGKIFSANNSSVGHGGGSPSPVGSAEDVSTLATSDGIGIGIGIGGEKISKFHSRGSFDYVDVIPPLSYHPRRRSSITISTTMTTPTGISSEVGNYTSSQYRSNALAKLESNSPITPTTPTTTTSTPISRTPSYTRHYHQQRQSLDGRGYKLSSPLDTPVHLVATPPSTNPGTNPGGGGGGAEMIPINRSASGGRKANRKPVPSYDEGLVPPTSASATLGGSSSPTPTPVSSNGLDRSNSGMSAREGGGGGKGLLELPELNHKSSFGDGRPVHYLIPDMPPPQRD